MQRFLLPGHPGTSMGVQPALLLLATHLGLTFVGSSLLGLFDLPRNWVPAVAAMIGSQWLGLWWERRVPGSLTDQRRMQLAGAVTSAQTVLGALLLAVVTAGGGALGPGLLFLALVMPIYGAGTWWALGQGKRMAGGVRGAGPSASP